LFKHIIAKQKEFFRFARDAERYEALNRPLPTVAFHTRAHQPVVKHRWWRPPLLVKTLLWLTSIAMP